MKIMYVVGYDISTLGGGQKSVKTCLDVTNSFGHKVSMVSPIIENKIELRKVKSYTYKRYNSRITNLILNTNSIYKYIKKEEPDLINCQYIGSIIYVGLLKKFRLINNIIVYTDRGFLDAYGRTVQILLKFISKSIDTVICTTNNNMLCWKNLFPNLNYRVIENVLESDWNEISSYKKDSGLNVGFSARYVPYKRWEDVIEIVNNLENYNINFNLAIAWNKEQKNEIDEFKNKIKNKKVTFYDNLQLEEMKDFYGQNDIFVLTSENESFGRTLIEAMSQKCTIIATNSGGVPSVVQKNLYNVGDISSCINLILQYYNDSVLLESDKEYFYSEFKHRFTPEIFSKKLYNFYEEFKI